MAVFSGAKSEKYISFILEEMGLSRQGPTKLLCDSTAAKMMANYKKPIERPRKIEVMHFSLQECVDLKQVTLEKSELTYIYPILLPRL